jgi:hypothetical protein
VELTRVPGETHRQTAFITYCCIEYTNKQTNKKTNKQTNKKTNKNKTKQKQQNQANLNKR